MKKLQFLSLLAVLMLLLCRCSDKEVAPMTCAQNEYVQSFTSGRISKNAPLCVILEQDVSQEVLASVKAEDVMSVSPSVKGSYSFPNSHTVLFSPSEPLAYETTYTVNLKLKKLFGKEASDFQFQVQTFPFIMTMGATTLDVEDNGDYKYSIVVKTLDEEPIDAVSSNLNVTTQTGVQPQVEWSGDGKEHLLVVKIKPTKEDHLIVVQKMQKENESTFADLRVPAPNIFSLYDMKFVSADVNYIDVSFNKQLDENQSLVGLAGLTSASDRPVVRQGNHLKIYLDNNDLQNQKVNVYVSAYLMSKEGSRFGKNYAQDVEVELNRPEVRLVGNGLILPQTDKIIVPFRAVGTRGVRVKLFKIYSNNVLYKMRSGSLDDSDEFTYYGRPILTTTYFMEDSGLDLSEWHNYALDLTSMVSMEPGAIYRVELSLDYRLSAWPGADLPKATKEEMEMEDRELFNSLNTQFDDKYGWYYMGSDINWEEYDYNSSSDPSSKSYYMRTAVGRNILVTNIGLLAQGGADNSISVIATHLMTARPMSDVSISIYNAQCQLLETQNTDAMGVASFRVDGKNGAAAYVVAKSGPNSSYLDVRRGSELSTSTFDVGGSEVQKGLKGYIYGERGVWRPGDTIHLGFMLNDKQQTLPEEHPVILEMTNSLGQFYRKITRTKGICGLYTFDIPTVASDPTGSWTAKVTVGGASFVKRLRVETIKPNRLKIDLRLPSLLSDEDGAYKMHTEWLNGNATHSLKYDVSTSIVATTTTFEGYSDYVFDDKTKRFSSDETKSVEGKTDDKGDALVRMSVPKVDDAPGMLRCNVTTRVYEESGEFSTDVQYADYAPYSRFVGVKSPVGKKRDCLSTGVSHDFDLVVLDKNGRLQSEVPLKIDVYKMSWYWWWSSDNEDIADYVSSGYNKPVATLSATTDRRGKTKFSLEFDDNQWGTYLIRVTDIRGGHSTSIQSYFDWPSITAPRGSNGEVSVTTLSLFTDKEEYKVGETVNLSMPSSENGRAIVSVCSGSRVLDRFFVDAQEGQTVVKVPVKSDYLPNVYLCVTLIQPYQVTSNDMPIRMYGIKPIVVSADESRLTPEIISKEEVKPLTKCTIKVKEKSGRRMAYTLAVVDEGLLDLTRFKTPNAWPVFNAREALGVRQWDLYSMVYGAFGGTIEQMFSVGGDEALYKGPKAIVNRFTPMVYFSGPFVCEAGKTNTHEVDVPNYNGRVRVMVVACDGAAYGSAEKSMLVRNSLMLTGTMPRQIGLGDEMVVSATVFMTESGSKDVKTTISCDGSLKVIGESIKTVHFSEPGDQTVQFRVKAKDEGDLGRVKIEAVCGSERADYVADMTVRCVSQMIYSTKEFEVAPGNSASVDLNLTTLGSRDQQSHLEISSVAPLNLNPRIQQLIAYPHGCVEQTISKAFPQLYLADFADLSDSQKKEVSESVTTAIELLAKFRTSEGGMAYWPGSMQSNLWGSAYALLFFKEAVAKGYYVDSKWINVLTKYISRQVKNWTSDATKNETETTAFALYVLASSRSQELGTMNRMKEAEARLTDVSRSLLSAAYSMTNNKKVAEEVFKQSSSSSWYGWVPVPVADLLARSSLSNMGAKTTADNIRGMLSSDKWMSTISTAMSIYAMIRYYSMAGLQEGMTFSVKMNDKSAEKVTTDKYVWSRDVEEQKGKPQIQVQNTGKSRLYASLFAQGLAVQEPVEAVKNGLSLDVNYIVGTANASVAELPQSTTFKAVVVVSNTTGADMENVALTHILPAGWEVLSTQNDSRVSFQDVRDDRVLTYFDHLRKGESVTLQLLLSATYVGDYYLPAVTVEAMYDASQFACTSSGRSVVK